MTSSNHTLFDKKQLQPNKSKEKIKPPHDHSLVEFAREMDFLKSAIQNLTLAFGGLESTIKNRLNLQVVWYKHHWVVAIWSSIATCVLLLTILKLTPLSLLALSEKDKSFHAIGKLKVQTPAREKTKKKN